MLNQNSKNIQITDLYSFLQMKHQIPHLSNNPEDNISNLCHQGSKILYPKIIKINNKIIKQ